MRRAIGAAALAAIVAMTSAARAGGAATVAQDPAAVCAAGPQSGNTSTARTYYDQARTEPRSEERVRLLALSLQAHASFEAGFLLGEVLLPRDPRAARSCYTLALGQAATGEARARAAARIAEAYFALGCTADHITWLKTSLKHHRYPGVEDALKAAVAKQQAMPVLSAGVIEQALGRCDPTDGATRSFGVEASIDLRINFAFDRADLTEQGGLQARELGRALRAPQFTGRAVLLIGHTDVRGDDAYNDDLSRRRAATVREFLVREFGLPPANVTVEGRGKRELLFSGSTEQVHALNRRVEVVVR